jgi:hypothetical protein
MKLSHEVQEQTKMYHNYDDNRNKDMELLNSYNQSENITLNWIFYSLPFTY